MNSITRHINSNSIIATLQIFRSARKDIILLVEGDEDIALFSQGLGLPRECFISCAGKNNLMDVFQTVPSSASIKECFCQGCGLRWINKSPVQIIVWFSDLYDFEMVLIYGRIFHRIFSSL